MPASPSEILRIWFERVWNAGDESAIDALYADNAVAHGLPAAPLPGPKASSRSIRSFRSAFPNIRIEITHAVSEGELGVVRCRVTGTHTGDGLGVAADEPVRGLHRHDDGPSRRRAHPGRLEQPTTSWACFSSSASSRRQPV